MDSSMFDACMYSLSSNNIEGKDQTNVQCNVLETENGSSEIQYVCYV